MTSSRVYSMLLFLLLLVLVFPDMDKALGEQMQLRKLKEKVHPDQLTTLSRRLLGGFPRVSPSPGWRWCYKWCKKATDLPNLVPPPPHRP